MMTTPTTKLEPRTRPDELHGFTRVAKTGDGKVYITVNYDEHGMREVFATVGRCGGTLAALAESIGRQISMLLQYGVPVVEITRCLIGIKSTNAVLTGDEAHDYLSIPDAIGKIIKNAPEVWSGSGTATARGTEGG